MTVSNASPATADGGQPVRRSTPSPRLNFDTTRWTLVMSARQDSPTQARVALDQLCRTYWAPLYAYARQRGSTPEDAQDLTQEFFARLVQRQMIVAADPKRGRFRSFLLASFKHFLADEWDKAHARKRGGGRVVSLDFQAEETRLGCLIAEGLAPDKAFEKRWAIALLEVADQRLEEEYKRQGKSRQFEVLQETLTGACGSLPYAQLGLQLGVSEAAVKMAVHRMRHRYRELLRASIADTVSDPEAVEDELRCIRQVLTR